MHIKHLYTSFPSLKLCKKNPKTGMAWADADIFRRQGQTAENQRPQAIHKTKGSKRSAAKSLLLVRIDTGRIPSIEQIRAATGQKSALNQSGASRVLTTNLSVAVVKIISFGKFFAIGKLFHRVIRYSMATLSAHKNEYGRRFAMNRQLN